MRQIKWLIKVCRLNLLQTEKDSHVSVHIHISQSALNVPDAVHISEDSLSHQANHKGMHSVGKK